MPDDTTGPSEQVKSEKTSLTTEDLYGTSKSGEVPLVYEETPIIDPVEVVEKEAIPPAVFESKTETPVPPPPKPFSTKATRATNMVPQVEAPLIVHKGSPIMKMVLQCGIIMVLFSAGVATSIFLRGLASESDLTQVSTENVSPTQVPTAIPEPTAIIVVPSLTITQEPSKTLTPTQRPITETTWVAMGVYSGQGNAPIAGLEYKIPPNVSVPTCDTSRCASRGTNLPAGTRFTVAVRGQGYQLPDPRGKILSDASGREFTLREVNIAGFKGTEFVGNFSGTTGGGFGFSQMHGVMLEVSDSTILELNHFSPSQKQSNFDSDHQVFEEILRSVRYIR